MDGRDRALDNIFLKILLRTLKCEWLYLKDYHEVRVLEL
ncbi:integrase catalytic region [Aminomonas paucivorans DSM 12260]|uniref:Integrase catalytic region n=1 Tax=Aminomonas paucivorans DSM 12260 TaxID=584708 RepID=E3CX42_9BACT|nr:integrase catalytic region [Aminomonas paucivorans DSM 12260]